MKSRLQLIFVIMLLIGLPTSLQASAVKQPVDDFCLKVQKIADAKTNEAFLQLSEMYKNATERGKLICLVEQLAEIDPERTTDFLIGNLQHDDANVRARAAMGLGVVKDKRAIEPLHRAFQDPDSGIRCNVARALGSINDPRSLPILIPELDSQNPAKRRCVIQALRNFNAPETCPKLYDIWMKDDDRFVQLEAGIAVVFGDCDCDAVRSSEHALSDDNCVTAQEFVDRTTDAVVNTNDKKEKGKALFTGETLNAMNSGKADQSTMMMGHIIMGVADWGESAFDFKRVKDLGSLEKNQARYFLQFVKLRQKEENLKMLCPKVNFPDFEFWNDVIQNNQN